MATAVQKITLSSSRDIPFNKLVLSQSNVRRVKAGVSLEELAEDIARRTLLQSLSVRPILDADGAETGMFEIPAGGRRYRALQLLVKQKRLAKNAPIPCVVRDAATDILAEDDSLAENIQRAPLHPLDQFRAFQAMRDKGRSEEDIAAAFFTSVNVVKQRLRLASVSPKLLDIYAEDGMSLEQLMAFTVSSDHARQEQVWETARQVYEHSGEMQRSRMASLVASKLRHGSHPGPTGAFARTGASGTQVLVGLITPGGPLLLKLEADSGRDDKDQLYGWGRNVLMPGLELARGVLETLAENKALARNLVPELSFFPNSFRVMITQVSLPEEGDATKTLADGELGSVPLGFLIALLSVVKEPPGRNILVIGRLGLKGDIDGVPDLEETLLAFHQSGLQWDRLVVAEAGGFRLLRTPAWLWHNKPVTMVDSAEDLVAWQSLSEAGLS